MTTVCARLLWAVIAALALSFTSAFAQTPPTTGDPVRGGRLFLQCRACHTVGATERDGVGPNLYGVVGARAASRSGYTYSPALAAAALTWTPQTLDRFLTRPSALAPGTRMAFAGVASAQDRRDLIAYLATLTPRRSAKAK